MATQFNPGTSVGGPESFGPASYVHDAESIQRESHEEVSETESFVEPRHLTQALGWFSIGLGLAEVFAPRAVGRAIGVTDRPATLQLCGVREIIAGVGLLSERAPSKWAMVRVAGDALDLALLGAAARDPGADRARIAFAATAVAGVTALDLLAVQKLGDVESYPSVSVEKSITINAAPDAVYRFWRDLENFPRFMRHLEEVRATGERTSHWVAKAPAGTTVEWDAEIVEDEANSRIGWRTLPDASVEHEGIVSFEPAPADRGTVVRVSMSYVPPAGKVGMHVAKLFGEEPSVQIDGDLRRMKQLIETGEVATTEGQSAGRRSILGRTTLGRWLS
jgi:uncharacterized membrane protein